MRDDYVALDLETTGLNPKTDRIIEIGALRVEGGRITDTYSALVRLGRKLTETVTALTGITQEMVEGEGAVEQEKAVSRLIAFTEGLPLLGHSILFDYSFVKRFAVNHGMEFERQGIDTLKIARRYLPDLESRRLPDLCMHYGISAGHSHRALYDAESVHGLYRVFLREFYEKGCTEDFEPFPLIYKVKREGPATQGQKERLRRMLEIYGKEPEYDIHGLTKNEASRYADRLILRFGRPDAGTGRSGGREGRSGGREGRSGVGEGDSAVTGDPSDA